MTRCTHRTVMVHTRKIPFVRENLDGGSGRFHVFETLTIVTESTTSSRDIYISIIAVKKNKCYKQCLYAPKRRENKFFVFTWRRVDDYYLFMYRSSIWWLWTDDFILSSPSPENYLTGVHVYNRVYQWEISRITYTRKVLFLGISRNV